MQRSKINIRGRVVIGIDPGKQGGIVILGSDNSWLACKMPEESEQILAFFIELLDTYKSPVFFIERIPKWTGNEIPGSAIATLYGNYQLCVGLLMGLGAKLIHVSPVKWQNLVECRNREHLETGAWKRKLKVHAKKLFSKGSKRITLWNCDALLIASAGRKLLELRKK